MSRLRRLVLSNRYFFVTCNLLRTRGPLGGDDFGVLARVIEARRAEHGFLLTAWVFLPDGSAPAFGVPLLRVDRVRIPVDPKARL